jgi:hypothetical protein
VLALVPRCDCVVTAPSCRSAVIARGVALVLASGYHYSAMSHHPGAVALAEAGRGRARRSGGARCIDGAAVPRADGPRAATPAVPAGGPVVHALAGSARSPQSARCVAVGQRLVAGDERASAAGRMRSDRAGGGRQRRSVVGGRAGWLEFIATPTPSCWYRLTTPASWPATWSTNGLPTQRRLRSASS